MQTSPATATVTDIEALLTFIDNNATEAVFAKAQELEMALSAEVAEAKEVTKDVRAELAELKDELTDGSCLASYATELGTGNLADFIYSLLNSYTIRTAIEAEMKDELKQADTTYLAIPETPDQMQMILAPRLAELITKLGIEESLRLLELA